MRTLVEVVEDGAGPTTALVEPRTGLTITYDDLLAGAEVIAGQLATVGVEPGDVVALRAANGPELVAAFLGICRLGAAAAPLNPGLTERETSAACRSLLPRAVLVEEGGAGTSGSEAFGGSGVPVLELAGAPALALRGPAVGSASPPRPSADHICLVLHTSGTTSKPKSVPLRQRNLAASAENIAQFYGLSDADTSYCVMPLFHIHGLVGVVLSTLASRGTVVIPRRVARSRLLGELDANGVTWISAVPTLLSGLLPALKAGQPSMLRFGRTSSSALPRALVEEFESSLSVPLVEAYGMTEASHQMTSNPLPPETRRPGSVGVPAGTSVRILDDEWRPLGADSIGEIAVCGPGVIDGYLDNHEANLQSFREGWFRTGDLGRLDSDGYLHIVGRLKEMINRGGEKIAPREIDEALLMHPNVAEAVAYGAPDGKYGEVVHAVVVACGPVDEGELRSHCGELLASFKVPARVTVLQEIPKSPTGKVQRNTLADLLGS